MTFATSAIGYTPLRGQAECSFEVRLEPQDYYPIGSAGVPTGRDAALEKIYGQ